MVQIIGRPERKEDAGDAFAQAIIGLSEYNTNKKKLAQENAAIKKQFGVDLSDIEDPKQRQEIVSQALIGKQKEDLLSKKFQIMKKEFPGLYGQPEQFSNEINKQETNDREELSDEELIRLGLYDPQTAKLAQSQKKERTRSKEKKEKAEQDKIAFYDKTNEDFINSTTQQYKAWETEMKPRFLQMQEMGDQDLISPISAKFLEFMGLPLSILENPTNELYDKVSQDLLKGLPETYGNRILKVEVENFLRTIPTLLNSPDGRRMIASNMLKLGEMKEAYYNSMRALQTQAISDNKPLPRDFQQKIFDQTLPQLTKISNEFTKLSRITKVPQGTVPFFSPTGNIEFVEKQDIPDAINQGGKRIW